jgi:hypothetical protein
MVTTQGQYISALEFGAPLRPPSKPALAIAPSLAAKEPITDLQCSVAPRGTGWDVELSLTDRAPTSLEVFDLAGRRIWSGRGNTLGPGLHRLTIAPDGTRPGLYLLRIVHGSTTLRRKVVRL